MSNVNEPWEDAPDWLEDLAIAVGTLVSEPKVMDRFRHMLRDWLAGHRKHGPRRPIGRRGRLQYNPVEFLPIRPLTLPEQYAQLAAIHDTFRWRVKRIDPWKVHKRTTLASVKAGTPYAVLCSNVREARRWRISRITDLVKTVWADLKPKVSNLPAIPEGLLMSASAQANSQAAPAAPRPDRKGDTKTSRETAKRTQIVVFRDARRALSPPSIGRSLGRRSAPDSIAAEDANVPNPSAPHTLKRIAEAWGGDMNAKKLRPMIGSTVKGKSLNRQTWIVCLDDLPAPARKKLAQTLPNSA